MNYRRYVTENSYIFITVVTYDRRQLLIENINVLRNSFRKIKKIYNFEIIAICILPDHFHMIIKLVNGINFSKIISALKHSFSVDVGQVCPTYDLKLGYKNKREKGIWQRRFYEHTIRDENDLNKHIDYIHYNSYKHLGIAPKNWRFSSFLKFVKNGYYELDWLADEEMFECIDCE